MAREESEREDLIREATALVERVEIILPDSDSIVAGFRPDGAFSVFFGEDPAYHFNAAGELRRAYCNGLLFKSMNGRLSSLRRERTAHETQLVRHDLTTAEQSEFLAAMRNRFQGLLASLAAGNAKVAGQVPPDPDILTRVRAWLAEHQELSIAWRPNVSG